MVVLSVITELKAKGTPDSLYRRACYYFIANDVKTDENRHRFRNKSRWVAGLCFNLVGSFMHTITNISYIAPEFKVRV